MGVPTQLLFGLWLCRNTKAKVDTVGTEREPRVLCVPSIRHESGLTYAPAPL